MPISLSYVNSFSGSLGAVFPVGPVDAGIRELQRELVRLGYLQNNTGPFGADGFWGPRMALALRQAAAYVGWTEDPYTPTNADSLRQGQVTIPDELIARIRAAAPDPNAVAAGTTPANTPPPATTPPPPARGLSAGWIAGLGIGAVMLTLGAIIAMKKDEDSEDTLLMGMGRIGSLPSAHIKHVQNDLQMFADKVRAARTLPIEEAQLSLRSAKVDLIVAYDNLMAATEDPRATELDASMVKKLRKSWIRANETLSTAQANLRARKTKQANAPIAANFRRGYYV